MTWLAGAVGLAALLRYLSRRRAAAPVSPPPPAPPDDDPADELRRKLADQRVDEETGEPVEAAETVDLEERRARVHARAQEAIDTMREPEADEPGAPVDPDGGAVA